MGGYRIVELTGWVLLSQRHAGHSRTLKKEFSTDLIHESRSRFVKTTLALGYSSSSSSVKLTQGASVVAYHTRAKDLLSSGCDSGRKELDEDGDLRCIFLAAYRDERALSAWHHRACL